MDAENTSEVGRGWKSNTTRNVEGHDEKTLLSQGGTNCRVRVRVADGDTAF